MGKPCPRSHPSMVKAQISIAFYQEINFPPSFQCFGKRGVKGAQFSAELHITATLLLVGSLGTVLRSLESPGPGPWLDHLDSRSTVLNCTEQDNGPRRWEVSLKLDRY